MACKCVLQKFTMNIQVQNNNTLVHANSNTGHNIRVYPPKTTENLKQLQV
jgi:hypothetical protein